MLYDARHDLYQSLAVSPDASDEEIRDRVEALRAAEDDPLLDDAAAVLLDLDARTRYDAERAAHQTRSIMRHSLGVFPGRTPAWGVPAMWSRDDD